MFIYRPIRSTLKKAMSEQQDFSNLKEMLEHLVKEHNNAFSIEDIILHYYTYDERIEWETYMIRVKKYGIIKYKHHQVIGFCTEIPNKDYN